jgi:uncharacterized protein (TIGR02757 family)
VTPDPLSFVYRYEMAADREIAALIAASLAYGRVAQIGRSVDDALGRLGPSPHQALLEWNDRALATACRGFRHRFTTSVDLRRLLAAVGRVLSRHGTLAAAFARGYDPSHPTIVPAAANFVGAFGRIGRAGGFPLLATPDAGSACKRLHLFLRWMVRRDDVDPGTFELDAAHQLVVPLDTHMHRIGLALGFTSRRQSDLRTALEITEGFRRLAPADPVRYDFVLARRGMMGTVADVIGERS